MELYHGGFATDHKHFWPLSHVGTRQAALDRIGSNFQDYEASGGRKALKSFLYRCNVDLGNKVLCWPDWNAANPTGLLLNLYRNGIFKVPKKEYETMFDKVAALQRLNKEAEALAAAFIMVKDLDFTAIRYLNRHEGEADQPSYMVVYPEQIEVINYEKIDRDFYPETLNYH